MKKIKSLKVKNKKVLVRVDFNVPLDEKGNILDNYRIRVSLPTIKYLKKEKAKIVLISHLGRPSFKDKRYSLRQVASELEKLLKEKVKFLPDCLGEEVAKEIGAMKPGQIVLLENLRFYQGETENDLDFAKKLAQLGDSYINDAFSVSHRSHASVVKLAELLPSAAGLLLQKEIEVLTKIKKEPKKPLVIIIGGKKAAKVESFPCLLEMADYLLVGGYLPEIILIAKGSLSGRPPLEKKVEEMVQKIDLASPKFYLPNDALISSENNSTHLRTATWENLGKKEKAYDIGAETIGLYSEIIKKAGTIFWAGPMGFFEKEEFSEGTKEIGESIIKNRKAFKVAGGGDTISAIKNFGWLSKFDHISTGGSALLKFLCGEELPGIKVLE